MTPEEYKAAIDAAGLTPCKPPFQGSTLHETRDGKFQQVPNPEHLSPDERVAIIAVINARVGGSNRRGFVSHEVNVQGHTQSRGRVRQ
jgi:hypothetical protein